MLTSDFTFKSKRRYHLAQWLYYQMYTQTYLDTQLFPTETKAGYLSVLPRGESQWGAAFSSCMCKCHAVLLQHLGKSTEEKLRVQSLCLLWRRHAAGYHQEVKKITLDSQTNFIFTQMDRILCRLQNTYINLDFQVHVCTSH